MGNVGNSFSTKMLAVGKLSAASGKSGKAFNILGPTGADAGTQRALG
jgi:hypothetical protein